MNSIQELLQSAAEEVATMKALGSEIPYPAFSVYPMLESEFRRAALLPDGAQLDTAMQSIMQALITEFPDAPSFPPSFFEAFAKWRTTSTSHTGI